MGDNLVSSSCPAQPHLAPDITLRNPQGLRIPFGVGRGGGTKLKNKNEHTSLLMAETGYGRGMSK